MNRFEHYRKNKAKLPDWQDIMKEAERERKKSFWFYCFSLVLIGIAFYFFH